MPLHDFNSNMVPRVMGALPQPATELRAGLLLPLEQEYSQHDPEVVNEHLHPGFRELDRAMKTYWSDIRVPTIDSYRFLNVSVAGGDRSILVWHDDIKNGRLKLPMAAVDRGSAEHNKDKYSPPIIPMRVTYPTKNRDRATYTYRPAPFLVDFTLVVWAEHKADVEYIGYQIMTRFTSGMAEFRMSDGQIQGCVQLTFGGWTDASDKEIGHDVQASYRYEYKMTAEAWLPLSSRTMPTVLGAVTTFRDASETIAVVRSGFSAM